MIVVGVIFRHTHGGGVGIPHIRGRSDRRASDCWIWDSEFYGAKRSLPELAGGGHPVGPWGVASYQSWARNRARGLKMTVVDIAGRCF